MLGFSWLLLSVNKMSNGDFITANTGFIAGHLLSMKKKVYYPWWMISVLEVINQ
jgi:hypothetical protein